MGARPPQNTTSEPDIIEFGIAAVTARVDEAGIEFPASDREIVDRIDDPAVPYDASGNTLHLNEALEQVESTQFQSESELLDKLHPVFEEQRASSATAVLGRLRRVFSF